MADRKAPNEVQPKNGQAEDGSVFDLQVAADPMNQVRELLFGDAERRTRDSHDALTARLDGMQAEIGARLDAIDAQVERDRRELRDHHAAEMRALGDRIARMGREIVEAAGKSEDG